IFFSYMYYFGLPVGYKGKPRSRAKKRGTKIDKRISGAMSFISAMASADVPVDVIFKELSKQTVYGEVAREAEWITRDTELLGLDILSAIRKAAQRSPSSKFQDFLQGVVTTSTSGGQLKPYFLVKAEQFEKEDRLEMRKKMETLGMLAESFVTVVVAFPLFLVVIMAIMALISKGSSGSVLVLLYVVVALMIPLSQFGFIFVIWNMEQEAGDGEPRSGESPRPPLREGRPKARHHRDRHRPDGARRIHRVPELDQLDQPRLPGGPAADREVPLLAHRRDPRVHRPVRILPREEAARDQTDRATADGLPARRRGSGPVRDDPGRRDRRVGRGPLRQAHARDQEDGRPNHLGRPRDRSPPPVRDARQDPHGRASRRDHREVLRRWWRRRRCPDDGQSRHEGEPAH